MLVWMRPPKDTTDPPKNPVGDLGPARFEAES